MTPLLRILMASFLLMAGACSTDNHMPPRPYTVMQKDAGMLSSIIATAGVEVVPPEGAPDAWGLDLAEALSAALQAQDIPALAGKAFSGSHRISGTAKHEPGSLMLLWILHDGAGATLSQFDTRVPLASDLSPQDPLPSGLAQVLADRAAEAFAPHLLAQHGPKGAVLRVYVADIANVPGDGGASLPLALRRALSGAGLQVISAESRADILISAQVHLSDLDEANQRVDLIWRVSAPDGKDIGLVEQSNPVPRGRLESLWGEVALAAAAGAVEGILPLLQDYQAKIAPR